MPVLVEARRADRDRFFGRTDGWHVEAGDAKYKPGEVFSDYNGELVFEDDGYRTKFRFDREALGCERVWIRCADAKSLLHVAVDHVKAVQVLSAGKSRVIETDRRKTLLKTHLSSSFRQDPSPYRKAVFRVTIGTVLFFTRNWSDDLELNDVLELTVSFKNCPPQRLQARGKSELVSAAKEFTTLSSTLGVSLVKVSDDASRVIHVDPEGEGFLEGVREGDLLTSPPDDVTGPRRWCRLETRQIVFDSECEFDFENDEDENVDWDKGGATSPQSVTFSLRLVTAADGVAADSSLEPLAFLFGSEPVKDSNGIGNSVWTFNTEATALKVSNVKEFQSNYIRILDPHLELSRERIPPSSVLALRVTLRASLSVSLVAVDSEGAHTDVALVSVRGIETRGDFTADGGLTLDAEIKSFQVDDQQQGAAFPVAIFPTPVSGINLEDAPAFRLIVSVRAPDPALISIRYIELFVRETTMRIHEGFLMGVADTGLQMASILRDRNQEEVAITSSRAIAESEMKIDDEARSDPELNPSARRIYIDEADLKPMRFNITFTSSASSAERSVRVRLRKYPVFAALITAVAAVSDAPLRLRSVRLERESKTVEGLISALVRLYSGEVIRGVLAIAGSTDLLGSPVHLLGSVSHGAFSFFYEPALALTMGYGNIGVGLQRGGSQLLSSSAGGLMDSLAKMSAAVAKAIAQATADPHFVLMLTKQLKLGGFQEPINIREGFGNGMIVLVRSLVDAVAGLTPKRKSKYQSTLAWNSSNTTKRRLSALLRPLLSLLLKPGAGFFAALNQISTGIRNLISTNKLENCFPLRLPRPRESKILPYSPFRSAGYLLARHRFGKSVQFVLNEICQLEFQLNDHTKHALVATVVTTDSWIVACRETLLDSWALPLDLLENVKVDGRRISFVCLGKKYQVLCRTRNDVLALERSFDFACKLRAGQVKSFESFTDIVSQVSRPSLLWTAGSKSLRTSLRSIELVQNGPSAVVGGNELDVAGCRVGSAEIKSYGVWPDGVYRYRIHLLSVDMKVEWIVQRRYSEFLKFRDQACRFLSVTRRSMPLPGRRPWKLSQSEHAERWRGLQDMLNLTLSIDLLAESEVLREFLTRGADEVLIRESF